MDQAQADAARAAVVEIENRLTLGEPVALDERAAAHAAYQDAERWRSAQEAQARRDAMTAQGITPGPSQTIGA